VQYWIYNGQLYVRYSTKKDVKCLKFVGDNCPGRATLKNENTRVTTEHAQHDAVTEEICKLKIANIVFCTLWVLQILSNMR